MSTDRDLINALKNAASKLTHRDILTKTDEDKLIEYFNKAEGTSYQKAISALKAFSSLTSQQITEKAASSDDTDRVMQDLENVLKDWKK